MMAGATNVIAKTFWRSCLLHLPITAQEAKDIKKDAKQVKRIMDEEVVTKIANRLKCTFLHKGEPEFSIGNGKRKFLLKSSNFTVYKVEVMEQETGDDSLSEDGKWELRLFKLRLIKVPQIN